MNRSQSLALVLVAIPLLASCQQYELQAVTPRLIISDQVVTYVGKASPAKMMLAVDTSLSMLSEVGPADPSKKWDRLVEAFCGANGFLDGTREQRLGLATFPDDTQCAGGSIKLPIAGQSGLGVDEIKSFLRDLPPVGGTPIASTLRAIAADADFMLEEPATSRFVLLLTDGLPNCDDAEPPDCICTATDPTLCTGHGTTPGDTRNCLDEDGTIDSVRALREAGVETFVIGFGEGTSGSVARQVLNAAAIEGGRARAGDTNYYQANSAAELQAVLEQIRGQLQSCNFSLEHSPADGRLISVTLHDVEDETEQQLTRGADWEYQVQDNSILVKDAACARIQQTRLGKLQLRYAFVVAER